MLRSSGEVRVQNNLAQLEPRERLLQGEPPAIRGQKAGGNDGPIEHNGDLIGDGQATIGELRDRFAGTLSAGHRQSTADRRPTCARARADARGRAGPGRPDGPALA